ncbi:MAG TPA: hypothetical protein VIT23_05065 [Terrimicrobiaceae bacterium]
MKRVKATYKAENTACDAQWRIRTQDSEALTAVHRFLGFKIQDPQTGSLAPSMAGKVSKTLRVGGRKH